MWPEDGAVFKGSFPLKAKTDFQVMKLQSYQVYKETEESDASSALTPS